MNRAVGYGRASTDKQTITIEVQEEKVKAYCQANDLDLVEWYEDPATSSRRRFAARPGGAQVCEAVAKGKASHIVIAKLDRAFRSTVECLTMIEEWETKKVQIHILDLNVDTGTPMGKFFLQVLSAVAEFERGLCSDRTKSALRHAQSKGKVVSRHVPYGFEWDKSSAEVSRGRWERMKECEEEQRILLIIDRLAQMGAKPPKIKDVLNGEGYRMRSGKPWTRQFVNRLMKRGKKKSVTP